MEVSIEKPVLLLQELVVQLQSLACDAKARLPFWVLHVLFLLLELDLVRVQLFGPVSYFLLH